MWESSGAVSGRADGGTTPIPQYYAVAKTTATDYYAAPTAADQRVSGILQFTCNKDKQSITVVKSGRSKVIAGGAFDEDDPLTTDSVGRLVKATGVAIVDSGANTKLTFTAIGPGIGYVKSISYVDPGQVNAVEYFEDLGGHIIFHLGTGAGGAIDTTADDLKTVLAANATIAAMISAVDFAGNDGSGTLTAEPAVTFAGGLNICARALEAASGAGSEVSAWLLGVA